MISTAGDIADFYERLFIGDFLGPEMLSAMLILVPVPEMLSAMLI